jgi:hypothetical protein
MTGTGTTGYKNSSKHPISPFLFMLKRPVVVSAGLFIFAQITGMNKEIQSIIHNLQNVNSGEPWFGRPVYSILEEVDVSKVYMKPGNKEHSLIELLYHMLTWAGFTLKSMEKVPATELGAFEKMDWREIDPAVHSWEK